MVVECSRECRSWNRRSEEFETMSAGSESAADCVYSGRNWKCVSLITLDSALPFRDLECVLFCDDLYPACEVEITTPELPVSSDSACSENQRVALFNW